MLHCGFTPDEAKRLGYHFDMFSFAYYAPPCRNGTLRSSFLATHRDEIECFGPRRLGRSGRPCSQITISRAPHGSFAR